MKNPKQICLELIASLTIADHMGDVSNELYEALRQLGEVPPDDLEELHELGSWLGSKGITTLYGTSMKDDE